MKLPYEAVFHGICCFDAALSDFETFTDQEVLNHSLGVYKMNQRQLLSSALASVMALGLVSEAAADMGAEKGKEKDRKSVV